MVTRFGLDGVYDVARIAKVKRKWNIDCCPDLPVPIQVPLGDWVLIHRDCRKPCQPSREANRLDRAVEALVRVES